MKIKGVAARIAADVRFARKLCAWRRELVHTFLIHPELIVPPINVLAVIASRNASRPAHAERFCRSYFSNTTWSRRAAFK